MAGRQKTTSTIRRRAERKKTSLSPLFISSVNNDEHVQSMYSVFIVLGRYRGIRYPEIIVLNQNIPDNVTDPSISHQPAVVLLRQFDSLSD